MTEYVPPTYKFFTFHIYFHTQTHIHIRTYFTTTSNNTKYKKSKYRIFTSKFTTLWTKHLQAQPTLQTHHLKIHLHSHLYIHNHNHVPPHKCITHHQNPINHKTYNIHLLRPMLTRLPSLPFQMKNHNV